MSILNSLAISGAALKLRKLNPHLSEKSAKYLAELLWPITRSEKDPQKGAEIANAVILERLKRGDSETISAVRDDLKKYRPVYEAAVKGGKNPAVELAMAYPFGGTIARQHVEMFKLIDGVK